MEASKSKTVQIGGLELNFLIDEVQSAGSVVMFEFVVPSNARVPAPHFHKDADEVVYGLDGTLTTTVDGETHEVRAGDSLFIRRGRVHHHENPHDETARVLVVMSPGSIGRGYFEEMAREVNVPGKPDLSKLKEIMLRHGLVPA